jgi:polysaccharide pyruvyl transferase WcaK-like protein
MKLILKKTKDVKRAKSMQETYKYYSEKKVDIVLAQRLHSIILSQVYEIPFIGISYSRKTTEVLGDLK